MTMYSPDHPAVTNQGVDPLAADARWTDEDDNWLRENYVARGVKECAEHLRRTPRRKT